MHTYRRSAVAAVFAAMACLPLAAPAADPVVRPGELRVFHIAARRVGARDQGRIMDFGFIPPSESRIFVLQPGLGRSRLYVYDVGSGKKSDLSRLLPDGAMPDSAHWNADGTRFTFSDSGSLEVVDAADRSAHPLHIAPHAVDSSDFYWLDASHVLGICGGSICDFNLQSGAAAKVITPNPQNGRPHLDGYFSAGGAFLWDTFAPEAGSSVFLSRLKDEQVSSTRGIPFPPLSSDSAISMTADGTYAVTNTNIGNGDSPMALLIGNIATGRWARLERGRPWGNGVSAQISPLGHFIAILTWPDSSPTAESVGALYVARVPAGLRHYLDGK